VLGTYFDVDRVEVVSGPQGTLYGRNATAGAVNVLTRNPTEALEGYVDVALGNYEEKSDFRRDWWRYREWRGRALRLSNG